MFCRLVQGKTFAVGGRKKFLRPKQNSWAKVLQAFNRCSRPLDEWRRKSCIKGSALRQRKRLRATRQRCRRTTAQTLQHVACAVGVERKSVVKPLI